MQSKTGSTPPLSGSWTHSYEEDEGDVRVYRPTDSFDFPLTRAGRETLVFGASGELVVQTPGPDDRPRDQVSQWSVLDESRVGLGGMPGAPEEVLEVVSVATDILKLRKL